MLPFVLQTHKRLWLLQFDRIIKSLLKLIAGIRSSKALTAGIGIF